MIIIEYVGLADIVSTRTSNAPPYIILAER
jgi:hypothetical protein